MVDYRKMTRRFMLGETQRPGIYSYLQSISEVLASITPRTQKDSRRVEMARSNIQEVKREFRRMNERLNVLEEQLKVLEENKGG
jgi:chromosome segregation ATPase